MSIVRPLLSVAAVVLSATLVFAAAAHASTDDDNYLGALSRHGITGDPAALITAGHDVCWALDQNWVVVGEALWKPQSEYAAQGVTGTQYAQARHDAVNAYCPDHATWRD
ncbi:DUF732 domain-containing protein [Mycobacterium sp.]|uniref:DUF732 domain-containing protein n=1 Tax=Mycobacterium sp. TaxID=1785 RepID=UPI0031DD188A